MNLGIAGKTALVLGASSGIGAACALGLAAEGVRLALAARRVEQLQAVCERARAIGSPDARPFALDLADDDSLERALNEAASHIGPFDILIANGGGPKPGTVSQLAIAEWDQAYRTLLRSMLRAIEIVLPPMRARGWGRVVALTSTSVKQPIRTLALSNAFRTALVSALKTLSLEVAGDGVTVNAIATGRILTDRLRELYGGDARELERAAKEVPAGRIAGPDEFAPMVTFLCGDPARYVTGQTIAVDGGLVAGVFG